MNYALLCKSKLYGVWVFIVNKLKRLCSPDAQTWLVFLLLRLSPNSDLLPALTVIGHCDLIGWLLGSWIAAHPQKNTNSQFGVISFQFGWEESWVGDGEGCNYLTTELKFIKQETFRRRWKRPLANTWRIPDHIVISGLTFILCLLV